ncbi:bifunctional [glutamate--ammonia ligase]-adenylyl-L-tyrosine phosphorylase/[glutamate--ammonia-ligase] adenylyltransferase [Desulfococcaceae bacterium HSG8]|nr:bifunctional [glutamate--ammonia ligase]-adenylyl-L-tyrosine phosphorylase/[glutamate--ammonia-ligase] adenylyltransferase [Desulfococcaceae bacterium HSG8]
MNKKISEYTKNKWSQFCEASDAALLTIPDDPEFITSMKRVFAFSDFVARTCIRNPEMPDELIRSGDLQKEYAEGEYSARLESLLSGAEDEASLGSILRGFRSREMIRIAWRDLACYTDLSGTMRELSEFAEACIQHALLLLYEWECEKFGIPSGKNASDQSLVVMGMGKLGACELNFSSDIDLIFAYPEPGETRAPGGQDSGLRSPVSNEEFFVRLCRRLIKVLSANTSEGFVFRVDMGLRPYGESGPLVMNFDALEAYYQSQGREWERYAWIKARPVAGDKAAGNQLLKRLIPFVYRRYLDFGVFESLREMKHKITLEVKRKKMKNNIKLGSGGIREIEFFGQIFQLTRGGVRHALQERSIQKVLRILAHENYIGQDVCDTLDSAYVFLRNTEHRLQEFSDKQTQDIPSDPDGQERIAASMGFGSPESFASELMKHRENVHRRFSGLLEPKNPEKGEDERIENALKDVWHNLTGDEPDRKVIADAGFDNPDDVLNTLTQLRDHLDAVALVREGRERIDKLIPLLLKEVGTSAPSAQGLDHIIDLIKAVKKRTSYISLLLENPGAITHLIRLAGSPWIISLLARHPVLLDELLDPRSLYVPPRRSDLERDLRRRLSQIPSDDLEAQMEELRIFKQINTMHVAAADITDVFPLMKVSDYLSDIAETILNEAIEISWNNLVEKHGKPTCQLGGDTFDKGFAVIAYGKLGGLELGYSSDLDLVFLHAGTPGETRGGKRLIDNAQFFGRLGQRLIHVMSTHTPAGMLYEADMRLRPSGSSGLLVCHIDAFGAYQANEAWTWEKQAIIKAKPVSGDHRIAKQFEEIRKDVLAQPRNRTVLQKEVRNMRQRMRRELLKPEPGVFDLKQSEGGMVDIEFLVQYLVLLKACEHPELLRWTDNVRLIGTLAETGVIDDFTAYLLRKAYLTYRIVGHRLSLREKPARVSEDRFRDMREKVKEIWEGFMMRDAEKTE